MTEEKKKPVSVNVGENSFELVLRILGNEFVAIKIGSTNFAVTRACAMSLSFIVHTVGAMLK